MNLILLKSKMKEKYNSQNEFARELGIGRNQMSEIMTGAREPQKPLIKLMSLLLGCTVEELETEPKPIKPVATSLGAQPSATSIIQVDELKGQITSLQDEIRALRNDLSMMAKMLIEINKTGHEAKAQVELNAEELTAIFSKVGEINGNVTKLYANRKRGY